MCLLLGATSCCGGTLSICTMSVLMLIPISGAHKWNKVGCMLLIEQYDHAEPI